MLVPWGSGETKPAGHSVGGKADSNQIEKGLGRARGGEVPIS